MSFKLNSNIEREIKESAGVQKGQRRVAEQVGEHARRFASQAKAPWIPRKGHKNDPIVVKGNRVYNTDHGWHLVEFGSKNSPIWAPLRRAIRAAGLKDRSK